MDRYSIAKFIADHTNKPFKKSFLSKSGYYPEQEQWAFEDDDLNLIYEQAVELYEVRRQQRKVQKHKDQEEVRNRILEELERIELERFDD